MRHYLFTGKVWKYAGKAAWYFVTLPEELADEIKALKSLHIGYSGGFGSIKVSATIGVSQWETSVFPDKKSGSYLLPLKKSVREANLLEDGSSITIKLVMIGI